MTVIRKSKIFICMLVAAILMIPSLGSYQAQAKTLYEYDVETGGYDTGTAVIYPSVPAEFFGSEDIRLQFHNKTTDDFVVLYMSNYNNGQQKLTLPTGTYVLDAATVDGYETNATVSLTPSEFTVNKGEETDEIFLKVSRHETEVRQSQIRIIEAGSVASDYLSISFYNQSDTYDEDGKQINFVQRFEGKHSINGSVATGNAYITRVAAYDENKMPLNVYYPSKFFTCRTDQDEASNVAKLYVFKNESDLSEEELAYIENHEYKLITADEMPKFQQFGSGSKQLNTVTDEELSWFLEGEIPKGDADGLYEKTVKSDITDEDIAEMDAYLNQIDGAEIEDDIEGEDGSSIPESYNPAQTTDTNDDALPDNEETKKRQINPAFVLGICAIAFVVILGIYQFRKRRRFLS